MYPRYAHTQTECNTETGSEWGTQEYVTHLHAHVHAVVSRHSPADHVVITVTSYNGQPQGTQASYASYISAAQKRHSFVDIAARLQQRVRRLVMREAHALQLPQAIIVVQSAAAAAATTAAGPWL